MNSWDNVLKFNIPEGEVAAIHVNGQLLWKKPRLDPTVYKEVEYIESTGTQWIDTGLTINTATDEVEFVFQNTEPTVYKWIMGEHDNGARFGLGSGDGVNKRNVAYGASTYKVNDTAQYDTQHIFTSNSNGVFLDGVSVKAFNSFKSTSTIYLFNLNLSSTGDYRGRAKVWSYTHKRNGELICELIPCYRIADNVTGMYDTVSKTFFTNKGTGEFLISN